jgi:hypothetical protein
MQGERAGERLTVLRVYILTDYWTGTICVSITSAVTVSLTMTTLALRVC